jgi:hypothetical protein
MEEMKQHLAKFGIEGAACEQRANLFAAPQAA